MQQIPRHTPQQKPTCQRQRGPVCRPPRHRLSAQPAPQAPCKKRRQQRQRKGEPPICRGGARPVAPQKGDAGGGDPAARAEKAGELVKGALQGKAQGLGFNVIAKARQRRQCGGAQAPPVNRRSPPRLPPFSHFSQYNTPAPSVQKAGAPGAVFPRGSWPGCARRRAFSLLLRSAAPAAPRPGGGRPPRPPAPPRPRW